MGWRRWDVLEQPGHVDPQGRQEPSIPRCLGPSPVTDRGGLQEKLTRLSCKEKKADDPGLNPTPTLLSLAKDFFFLMLPSIGICLTSAQRWSSTPLFSSSLLILSSSKCNSDTL